MPATNHYSLQGVFKAYAKDPTTGMPTGDGWDMGHIGQWDVSFSPETVTAKDRKTGKRGDVATLVTGRTGEISIVAEEASANIMALNMSSTAVAQAAGNVTNEAFPTVAAGDYVQLDGRIVSAVVITDSAGSPATLVAGSDYEVVSSLNGLIRIIDPAGFTQPFKAAYTNAAGSLLAAFSSDTPPELYVTFDGVETVYGRKCSATFPRISFPGGNLSLINEEFGTVEMTANILYDEKLDKGTDTENGYPLIVWGN